MRSRITESLMPDPILKWAGGKRKMRKQICPAIHETLERTGGRYIEPFLGGGAIALDLALGERMILSDFNVELMNLYRTVRDEPALVAWALSALACGGVDKAAYLYVRGMRPEKPEFQAARMVYLNRLGFNGLYRVNQSGEFNVPYAEQKYRESTVKARSRDAVTSLFPHKGKFEAVSDAFKGSTLLSGDFARVMRIAGKGDVVYCDPPYDGTYAGYTPDGFNESDQTRLAVLAHAAWQRGAHVMVSNANTPLIRDIYGDFASIMTTKETRTINSNTNDRKKKASCLLIVATHND